MNRVLRYGWGLAGLVLASYVTLGGEAKNLLLNPGFEQDARGQIATWQVTTSWQGTLEVASGDGVPHTGKRGARLSAVTKDGKAWGRMFQPVRPPEITARRFRFSVWAKGQGECLLGIIQYTPPQPGKVHYTYTWQEKATPLTDTWQELSQELLVLDPQVQSFGAVVEVRGNGANALVDDAALVRVEPAGITMRVTPPFAMVAPGNDVPLDISTEDQGKRLNQGTLKLFLVSPDATTSCQDVAKDAAGATRYNWTFAAAAPTGIHRLIALHVDSGAVAEAYADIAAKETIDAFEQAAAKVRLAPVPAHLLFIGDSLTDFQRGYNYVDKVAFWLQRRFGDQVTFRNAGVGGDFISRVLSRLNREPSAYRLSMYDNLFEPSPTHVFVFLGHNDSKVSSTSDYTEQAVLPAKFEEDYRAVLGKIRAETKAKVTVLSATSSVFEICQANADKARTANRPHSLFGKPEELERYNVLAKNVAAEAGAAYLDVYEPTRTHPDKRSLFDPNDGVHLTNAGNHFIALQLLQYLGGE
ncbi:MAG: hypothetical protein A3K19_01460 [Lentisphaerae bacterium RIFOXYB12_FULL_65_16]|nr:MAG: hypothetical protein A3K18_22815 [Lentisphaerae bacterium RIFOXYA12_64_32]OGV92808.1 MAG: hypothetical protein A3K19_01460 [Lentisphaerae bacterium RIFOXYB12_FULL_65_16]